MANAPTVWAARFLKLVLDSLDRFTIRSITSASPTRPGDIAWSVWECAPLPVRGEAAPSADWRRSRTSQYSYLRAKFDNHSSPAVS